MLINDFGLLLKRFMKLKIYGYERGQTSYSLIEMKHGMKFSTLEKKNIKIILFIFRRIRTEKKAGH